MILVTNITAHFVRIPGLQVEDWLLCLTVPVCEAQAFRKAAGHPRRMESS